MSVLEDVHQVDDVVMFQVVEYVNLQLDVLHLLAEAAGARLFDKFGRKLLGALAPDAMLDGGEFATEERSAEPKKKRGKNRNDNVLEKGREGESERKKEKRRSQPAAAVSPKMSSPFTSLS